MHICVLSGPSPHTVHRSAGPDEMLPGDGAGLGSVRRPVAQCALLRHLPGQEENTVLLQIQKSPKCSQDREFQLFLFLFCCFFSPIHGIEC